MMLPMPMDIGQLLLSIQNVPSNCYRCNYGCPAAQLVHCHITPPLAWQLVSTTRNPQQELQ